MHYVKSNDLAEDYHLILRQVLETGHDVAPRGKQTREVLAFTLELTDPTRALVRGTERKIAPAVAAAEAMQLIGGFSDPRAMMSVSPHFSDFLDGGVFHAPYGPRIATQVPEALDWLRRDPDSRKAHISVWQPQQDLWTHDTRDHPCTTHLQFMIRDGKVDLHVGMRANDAWRGFPYDVFQFCQLQLAACACLCIPPGTYYHHATSFHLYEENWEDVGRLMSCSQAPIDGLLTDIVFHPLDWGSIQQRARNIFYGQVDYPDERLNDGELLMYKALRARDVRGEW